MKRDYRRLYGVVLPLVAVHELRPGDIAFDGAHWNYAEVLVSEEFCLTSADTLVNTQISLGTNVLHPTYRLEP